MTTTAINKIIIAGSGLASWMTAAALSKNLPSNIEITILETPRTAKTDIFYGTVTPPSSYDFFLKLGLTEADLVTRSHSSFSYGTQYQNWGLTDASWVQCYHSPFPSWNGVPLSHHICSHSEFLETYLVSAQAGLNGRFAHPPADRNIVLSAAEFGYHFKPHDITKLMKMIAVKNGVMTITQDIKYTETNDGKVTEIVLANDDVMTADLYVDATGQKAKLLSSIIEGTLRAKRTLGAFYTEQKNKQLGPPLRRISSHKFGWQSITPLQKSDSILTIFDPSAEPAALETHATDELISSQIEIGHRKKAWSGNCVAIGHAAAAIDPISPAPITLLQLDITRLMELIPVSKDFTVEANIFNEAYLTDVKNVELFNAAFYYLGNLSDALYWTQAKAASKSPELDRKLKQITSRGLLVSYDLEPFNNEDWTILHHGVGRIPQRKDRFAKLSDRNLIDRELKNKENSIKEIVGKMPPHHIYMANYLNYLERNHVSDL